MLRIFVDQDLDHDILRGLHRRLPRLDAVTALHAGLDVKLPGKSGVYSALDENTNS